MKIPDPKRPRYTGPRSPQARDREQERLGRLPHGAMHEGFYDATRNVWTGWLIIPSTDGRPQQHFRAEAAGYFFLCSALFRMYREWAAAGGHRGKDGAA